MNEQGHIPVLLEEVLNCLNTAREGTYVDCTLGLAGHALEILKRNPKASLIGFDIDENSLLIAKKRLRPYASRVQLYYSDFRYLPDLKIDFASIRGIMLDLGISSFQLDSPERGFSFNSEGPLDMRLDVRHKITASKILNQYSEPKLAHLFQEFGELKQAKKLAQQIATRRRVRKIETTTELRQLVEEVCHWRPQKGKIHPAAKVFQALRIEVNHELESLSGFLKRIVQLIPPQSRLAVLSFHSLEDRIIKHTFAELASPDNNHPLLNILTKKPVTPSEEEVARNSRAHSAKLRAAEKI
jgi:16S rRNA (cytosine1402-N4)-methyltransferase